MGDPTDNKPVISTMLPSQITTWKLNGQNYLQWAKAVKVYLIGQDMHKHLTKHPPTNQTKLDMWVQKDAQLVSLLWNSMEPNVTDICTHLDTCKEIWDYVKLLYASDLIRMYDLSIQYFELQKGDKTITEYFTKLKRIYEELNVIQPISTDIQKMQKQREQMIVLQFLAGLPSKFEPVKA